MTRTYIALAAGTAVIIGLGSHLYAKLPDRLTRVIDGDTIVINGTTHVRLFGIDSPELDQTCTRPNPAFAGGISWHCGQVSSTYLASMFKSKMTLKCDSKGTDVYKRTVAVCWLRHPDGKVYDIGKSMVAAGMALDWPKYSNGDYAQDERYAAAHKLGMWAGYFQKPWDYRAQRGK